MDRLLLLRIISGSVAIVMLLIMMIRRAMESRRVMDQSAVRPLDEFSMIKDGAGDGC